MFVMLRITPHVSASRGWLALEPAAGRDPQAGARLKPKLREGRLRLGLTIAILANLRLSVFRFDFTTLGATVLILVRDNNVDQALRVLKKKLQQEGIVREMRLREHFEKPSEKRAREKAEGIRRARKLAQKKLNKELGLGPAKKSKPSRSK